MTYDRRAIMQAAWTIARRFAGNRETWGQRLSRALKSVWWDMKQAARVAAQVEAQRLAALATPPRSAADLWAEIIGLENADRLGWAGM
jgi:hypothetical protein